MTDHLFRLAVVTTAYFRNAHADVMVSRWLEPRPTDNQWQWPAGAGKPRTEIVSLYIAPSTHHEEGDPHREIGREIAKRRGVPVYDSIRGALTLDGPSLAVDGVLFIGEHGDYPLNDLGQKMYPRYEIWKEIVAVMQEAGRFVPLFSDKHLSTDSGKALEMFATSRKLGIPFMAGSSLPLCKMAPEMHVPANTPLTEAVSLFYGSPEAYGFHILEVTQGLIERRPGGESGVKRIAVWTGDVVWKMLESPNFPRDLYQAALDVTLRKKTGSPREICHRDEKPGALPNPMIYQVEHADGFMAYHVLLHGYLEDFVLALRRADGTIQAGVVDAGDAADFYGHFAALDGAIEEFFLTGKITSPLERTLLTTMTIAAVMEAIASPNAWHETKQLLLPYQVPVDAPFPHLPNRPAPVKEPDPPERAFVE
jgi:hypothetical protein